MLNIDIIFSYRVLNRKFCSVVRLDFIYIYFNQKHNVAFKSF
jgi:hypothetical protein